jgi:serine/threonine-protein kinase
VAIEAGQQLLHYRIVEKIGEGGMGAVWKAVDTTLDREVAIKVLPDWVSAPEGATPTQAVEERLERFEREAKLLATLNHPNIAAVYGLHQSDDICFIVMELVDGEDLAEHLKAGRLPLEESLTISRQVAAALAAAHDSGVIHRDLKPANIRLTPEGRVKVLDFGLAKAFDVTTDSGTVDAALSPTLTSAGTRAGVILGTAAYMSPEQARGKPVDRRTDIWSFGCVLYEMLTGKPAFDGETVTDILAAILRSEPDMSPLAGTAPPRVRRLLTRCLEKRPAQRLRDAGDLRIEIDGLLAGDLEPSGTEEEPGTTRSAWARLALVAVGALILGVVLARLAGIGGGGTAAPELRRMTITTGDGRAIHTADVARVGGFLVLELDDGAYVRLLDSYELQPIPESRRMVSWAASPDGRSIAFYTIDDEIMGGGKLRRMELATGTTVTIRESSDGLFPVFWDRDGILAVTNGKEIFRVSEETGDSEVVFETEEGRFLGASPIPGTSAILSTLYRRGVSDGLSVEVVDLATKEQRRVAANARGGVATSGGHLVVLRDGTLVAGRFDPSTLQPTGSMVPILSGVRNFGVSDDGILAYIPADENAQIRRLVQIDGEGEQEVLTEGILIHARYAPNGRWVSAVLPEAVNLVDRGTGSIRPLLNDGFGFADHVWRPDSEAIVYTGYSVDGSRCVLFEHPIDGSAPRVLMETDPDEVEIFPTGYAPDGSGLIVAYYQGDDADLWWHPADGSDPSPLLASRSSEDLARFSPDGRWVAYESNETGRQEVWVAVYRPDEGRLAEKWRISQRGGKDPIWSHDGGTLYYENLDDRLVAMAVSRSAEGQPVFGERTVRLDLRALNVRTQGDQSYDVAPTGDGMVLIQEASPGAAEVRVVLDWFVELERLVPGG